MYNTHTGSCRPVTAATILDPAACFFLPVRACVMSGTRAARYAGAGVAARRDYSYTYIIYTGKKFEMHRRRRRRSIAPSPSSGCHEYCIFNSGRLPPVRFIIYTVGRTRSYTHTYTLSHTHTRTYTYAQRRKRRAIDFLWPRGSAFI